MTLFKWLSLILLLILSEWTKVSLCQAATGDDSAANEATDSQDSAPASDPNLTNAPIHLLAKNVRTVPLQFKLRIFRGVNYFIQLTDLSRQESLSGGVWCADNSKSFISPVMLAKTR